jgi:hypothetical protein
MSACTITGTVRPETTARASVPPTSDHFTGRSDNALLLRMGTADATGGLSEFAEGALLAAKSGIRQRNGVLFITLNIRRGGLCFATINLLLQRLPVQTQTSKNSGYRTFLDARGRLWEVWMVHPSSIERRRMERRSPVENAVFLIEQRVLGDRRIQTGSRGAVASEYSSGWLCFASNGEKRRLAPVPVNWMSANDSQVAEWCRVAQRVLKCGPTWDPADEIRP